MLLKNNGMSVGDCETQRVSAEKRKDRLSCENKGAYRDFFLTRRRWPFPYSARPSGSQPTRSTLIHYYPSLQVESKATNGLHRVSHT